MKLGIGFAIAYFINIIIATANDLHCAWLRRFNTFVAVKVHLCAVKYIAIDLLLTFVTCDKPMLSHQMKIARACVCIYA